MSTVIYIKYCFLHQIYLTSMIQLSKHMQTEIKSDCKL